MTGTLINSSPLVGSLVAVGAPPFATVNYLPFVGQPVSGTGIPAGVTVLTVTDPADIVKEGTCEAVVHIPVPNRAVTPPAPEKRQTDRR